MVRNICAMYKQIEIVMKNIYRTKKFIKSTVFCIGIMLMSQGVHADTDHGALFYSTSAHWDKSRNEWVVPIRGYVYSKKLRSPVGWIASWLGDIYAWFERREDLQEIDAGEIDLDDPDGIADISLIRERAKPFLLKGKGDYEMLLTLGDRTWLLEPTNEHGYIHTTLRLGLETLPKPANKIGSIFFEVRFSEDSNIKYTGKVYLVPASGLSVISDIDDTIKYSEVLDREELLENTLLYPFSPIQGMAEWYQSLERCGAAFHYVSKSPWQLYSPLAEFIEEEGFPPGSFYLRNQKTIGLKALWKTKGPSKKDYIRELLQRYPGRKFILVGDSTQQDPAIYADLAKEFPNQIHHIFIRKVKHTDAYLTESLNVLTSLDKSIWTVFTDPVELVNRDCVF